VTRRKRAGEVLAPREHATLASGPVPLPDPEHVVHLQFRRYSGCPICHLHLRSFANRHGELLAAGVREVAVFHSSAETMTGYQAELPFAVVADPARALYRNFGVEQSLRAVLHPRAWAAAIRGWSRSLPADDGSGHLGRPADFLIAPDGRLLACRYGAHANDQWSVDDLLGLVHAYST
jgi:hypothetical protein